METPPILTPPPPESTLPPKTNSGLKWGIVIGVAVVSIGVILLLGFLIILGAIASNEEQASAEPSWSGVTAEEMYMITNRVSAGGPSFTTNYNFGPYTPLRPARVDPLAYRGVQVKARPYNLGTDHTYQCGSGYGHVRITTYGTSLTPVQQKNFADRGPFMIQKFRQMTGFAPPSGFYYEIHFFANKSDYPGRANTLGFCKRRSNSIISDIYSYNDGTKHSVDTVTHEMIHAISNASCGSLPLCFSEGLADYLGDSHRKRIPSPANFYHYAQLEKLAGHIRKRDFPSLSYYLYGDSYDDWDMMFNGDRHAGYTIGAMLFDYLWRHHQRFLLNALAFCIRHSPDNRAYRSRAFRYYVKNNWPGGFSNLDRKYQSWILDRAKYKWEEDR